jgi:PTH1 family peptidyl-tRNA hydrolase
VRIGIGRPPYEPIDIKAWVLADFGRDEQSGWVPDLLDAITDEINRLCRYDDSGFMSRVAYLAPAPSP